MILFADDTNLLFELEDQNTHVIQNELINIAEWFSINKLSLNISKTKYMLFGKNKSLRKDPICLKINDINISQVNSISFLGVMIQDNLKWNENITIKGNKISKVNSILYRMKHVLPETVMIHIYNALVVPHLNYAILA